VLPAQPHEGAMVRHNCRSFCPASRIRNQRNRH
jgi:hypothetical protein